MAGNCCLNRACIYLKQRCYLGQTEVLFEVNRASVYLNSCLSLIWNKPPPYQLSSRWWETFTSAVSNLHLRAYKIQPSCWATITCVQNRHSQSTMVLCKNKAERTETTPPHSESPHAKVRNCPFSRYPFLTRRLRVKLKKLNAESAPIIVWSKGGTSFTQM